MESDIVERLRDCTCVPHGDICREAADEIEELRRQLTHAREICSRRGYHREQLERELVAMRQQRDDARRWLRDACAEIARIETRFYDALPPQQIAERNGWQCFAQKEGGGA